MSSDQGSACQPHADGCVLLGLDGSRDCAHSSKESKGFGLSTRALLSATLRKTGSPNKRFGAMMHTRRIAGDRTGEVSLAPKLIAEGKNV